MKVCPQRTAFISVLCYLCIVAKDWDNILILLAGIAAGYILYQLLTPKSAPYNISMPAQVVQETPKTESQRAFEASAQDGVPANNVQNSEDWEIIRDDQGFIKNIGIHRHVKEYFTRFA